MAHHPNPLMLLCCAILASVLAGLHGVVQAQNTNDNGGFINDGNSTTDAVGACNTTVQNYGNFQWRSPSVGTIVVVGNQMSINWTYFDGSTIPNTIALYYAFISNGGSNSVPVTPKTYYNNPISTNIPGSARSYQWTVPQLQTGQYRLRIVGDNFDPAYAQSQNREQCGEENQVLPSMTTNAFRIVEGKTLVAHDDRFGPSNGAAGTTLKHKSSLIKNPGFMIALGMLCFFI